MKEKRRIPAPGYGDGARRAGPLAVASAGCLIGLRRPAPAPSPEPDRAAEEGLP